MKDIATVKDLLDLLETNFKPTDKLCFFDEGGAWCEVEHVSKCMIGDIRWMFNYVKDKKQNELDDANHLKNDGEHMKKIVDGCYKSVNGNDVLIF